MKNGFFLASGLTVRFRATKHLFRLLELVFANPIFVDHSLLDMRIS